APGRVIMAVEDYLYAPSPLAQTTPPPVLAAEELDELLSGRQKINGVLKRIIAERTDACGTHVSALGVRVGGLPDQVTRARGRQAEAERERRAKVIAAQGELQASETLAQAANTLAREPLSLQLRYLQTVTEIAAENNSTTLFPIPIDMIKPFLGAGAGAAGAASAQAPRATGTPSLPAPDPTLPQFRIEEREKAPKREDPKANG